MAVLGGYRLLYSKLERAGVEVEHIPLYGMVRAELATQNYHDKWTDEIKLLSGPIIGGSSKK